MTRFTAGTILVAAAFLSAAPAAAQQAPTRRVSFADLDLAKAAGQKVLARRISWAVDAVCGRVDATDLPSNGPILKCRHKALADAQVQMASVIARAIRQASIEPPDIRTAAR